MTQRSIAILGAGPAGCSAALMAHSLGWRVTVVEKSAIGNNVRWIPHLRNVLGQINGKDLARTLQVDLERLTTCELIQGYLAEKITIVDIGVEVLLHRDVHLFADYCLVATGLRQARTREVPWIVADHTLSHEPSHFWKISTSDIELRRVLVLGADRQIGTFLRTIPPDFRTQLLVLHPKADAYRVAEVASDPRVEPLPTTSVSLSQHNDIITAKWQHLSEQGELHFARDLVINNLGGVPSLPSGVPRTADGYPSPARRDSRIAVAGDIRSPQYQRISTAIGSGAEEMLRLYYHDTGISAQEPR